MSLKSEAFVFTMTQVSTFSGANEALFGVITLPATEKTRSLLLLATGIAKTTLTRKARRGSASWWFFHQFSGENDNDKDW